jgi:hypothetical protein
LKEIAGERLESQQKKETKTNETAVGIEGKKRTVKQQEKRGLAK